MKTTAYLRISTSDQDIDKNKADILKLANDKKFGYVEFVEEQISGTVSWKKRKIFPIIQNAKEGDVVIVSELSRLGRSMLEIMEILSIASEKKLSIYSVKGDWHLDSSIQSKIMAMVFAMASEIERELISVRTKEALRAKKAQGIKLGRPRGTGKSKLDKYKIEIEANLYNWMKKNGLKKVKKKTV